MYVTKTLDINLIINTHYMREFGGEVEEPPHPLHFRAAPIHLSYTKKSKEKIWNIDI